MCSRAGRPTPNPELSIERLKVATALVRLSPGAGAAQPVSRTLS